MEHLLEVNGEWDYYMNLAGSTLPALPLPQMESAIKNSLNGASVVESSLSEAEKAEKKYLYAHKLHTSW